MTRRMLRLGTLTVHGDRFSFKPTSARELEVEAGEEFDVAVVYTYEETSEDKETFDLQLLVEANGRELPPVNTRVRDRPMVKDEVEGVLAVGLRLAEAGEIKGAYTIEAATATESWTDPDRGREKRFYDTGTFVVRAR